MRGPAAFLALSVAALPAAGCLAYEAKDPLAAEIRRWSAFVQSNTSREASWLQVKEATQPLLASAGQALRDGRRLLALQLLARTRTNLAATVYVSQRLPAQRQEPAAFEAEWARMGTVLHDDLGALSPAALDGVRPAAVRALGEAALPEVRVYYEASLEYGRNTMPRYGLFYLGLAQAQRDFAAFCRRLSAPSSLGSPPVRALGGELDALEGELLAAYRPPAAIAKHGDFIAASSLLKEARELDAAGLRFGALLRYLQSAQRLALLRGGAPPLGGEALAGRLRALAARLSGGVDHSLGRLFLEAAQEDAAGAAPGKAPATAEAIAGDVLPRYFAALAPAPPAVPRPAPEVTVTLVRWPYT